MKRYDAIFGDCLACKKTGVLEYSDQGRHEIRCRACGFRLTSQAQRAVLHAFGIKTLQINENDYGRPMTLNVFASERSDGAIEYGYKLTRDLDNRVICSLKAANKFSQLEENRRVQMLYRYPLSACANGLSHVKDPINTNLQIVTNSQPLAAILGNDVVPGDDLKKAYGRAWTTLSMLRKWSVTGAIH